MRVNDYLGLRFGRLTVLERLPRKSKTDTNARWLCRCDCGRATTVYGQDLKRGRTQSCGCLQAEVRMQHGMAHTPVYAVYKQMLQRCENPNSQAYENYGGRGIKVCDEWHTFEKFFADMGDRPKGFSIDRIDVNGNYCKENCRWVVSKVQNNNKRNNRHIEFNGETHTLGEWAEKLGVEWTILRNRIDYYNWSIEKALTTPVIDVRGETYTLGGITLTLREWSNETGISFEALRKRVQKLNWTIEKALNTPVSKKGIN